MTFKDDNLRFVVLKALADAVTDELAQMRADHLGPLLERYDEEGTKSFSVRLPSTGALIGALTLPEPKDKYEVTDEAAFTAWFAENHPDAVTVEVIPGEPERTVVVPATPDETITTIDPKHRTAIMKALKSTDDGIVDTVTGSYVQGVKFSPGKRPDKFSVTYEPEGREQLAAAYRAGELDGIVTGTALPPVSGRIVIEQRLIEPPAMTVVPPAGARKVGGCWVPPAEVYDLAGVPESSEPISADANHWSNVPGAEPGQPCPGSAEVNLALGSEDYDDELATKYAPGGEYDPWAEVPVIGEQAADFDPGSWGAPSDATGTGW